MPLTLLSWVVTHEFGGLDPTGYHLGNWILHGLNTFLCFFVIRQLLTAAERSGRVERLSRLDFGAATGALLWALHPLRVEPVAWATARSYDLAVFFCCCARALICTHPSSAAVRRCDA
jgi:hypothetical protein